MLTFGMDPCFPAFYRLLHLPKIACAGSKLARNVRNREQSIPMVRSWPDEAGRIKSTVSVNDIFWEAVH